MTYRHESNNTMDMAIATRLETSDFEGVVADTRQALSDQGFGILTEIDVTATMEAKLGEKMERYLILGACNPPLAHRALEVTRQIGLLLPCNVVVREDGDAVMVEAMNPELMVKVVDDPGMEAVAADATSRLRAAIDALNAKATSVA